MIQGPLKELYIENIIESGMNPYSFHCIFQAKNSLRISCKDKNISLCTRDSKTQPQPDLLTEWPQSSTCIINVSQDLVRRIKSYGSPGISRIRNCIWTLIRFIESFPSGSVVKTLPAMQEQQEMQFHSLGQGDPLEVGHDNPLKHSCLEKPIDRGVWWTTGYRATDSDTTEVTYNTCKGWVICTMMQENC